MIHMPRDCRKKVVLPREHSPGHKNLRFRYLRLVLGRIARFSSGWTKLALLDWNPSAIADACNVDNVALWHRPRYTDYER